MPLLGSYGGSSEYAYRGTIDDFPNDFSFTNQTNAIPGNLFTSNQVTITGINNRALVRVSAGASVSVNGGSYVIPTEASPVFIRNNQTLSVRIPSTSGQLSDFDKLYSASVNVGKKSAVWQVRTKIVDVDPTPFTFTNQTNGEIGIAYTSNEITISGLEAGFSFPADITSGSGQIIKNGGTGVPSVSIVNGDRIFLRLISPFEYSEFPTGSGVKTNSTIVRVGSYSTSWSVSSRNVDVFINPFEFNDINNALTSTVYTEESVNLSGIVTTITGADQGIPLVTAVTGCELQVEQPAAGGGFSIRRAFSPSNAIVFNGDRLRARLTSSPNFSETRIGIVTVSSFAGRFIVTTRPRPIDTIPDAFTFTDITANRGSTIESNEVTLVGMTTFTDEGVASLTTGTNGGDAQFQVTRGTQIIRSYTGIGTYPVRNGDKIKLRITAAAEQNITRTATFRVDGIDTSIVITGTTAFRDDIWSVTSATRVCDVTPFTIPTLNNAELSTLQTTSFTVNGFQFDCGMIVSTNVGTLSIPGSSLTNNIPVSPGTVVTLRVTSAPSFATPTVATVTVSNSASAIIPSRTYSTTWTINNKVDSSAATISISASPSPVLLGNPVTLTWTSNNAASVSGFTGQGFNPTTINGTATVTPTSTQAYSISVTPNPTASNSPQVQTASVNVTIQEDTSPDSFTMSPSSFSSRPLGSTVTSRAVSSANSNVSVTGLTPSTTVPALVSSTTGNPVFMRINGINRGTSFNVQNNDVIEVILTNSSSSNIQASATLSIGGSSQTFTSTTVSQTTTVTLTASPTSVQVGQTANLTWTTTNAELITGFSGPGFNPTNPQGGTIPVTLTTAGTQSYSISVRGPSTAANFPNSVTASANITAQNDTTPDSFSISPSVLTNQARSSEVSALAQSSANPSVSVTGLTDGITVNASISGSISGMSVNNGGRVTSANVRNGDSIRVFMTNSANSNTTVTGTLTIGNQSSSFSSQTASCNPTTSSSPYGSANVIFTEGRNPGQTTTGTLYYTSRTGGFTEAKSAPAQPGGTTAVLVNSSQSVPVPSGSTQVKYIVIGGGGGGSVGRGGGGGGLVEGTRSLSPGTSSLNVTIGSGGGSNSPGGSSSITIPGSGTFTAPGGGSGSSGGAGGSGITGNGQTTDSFFRGVGGIAGGSTKGGNPGTSTGNTSPTNTIRGGGGGGVSLGISGTTSFFAAASGGLNASTFTAGNGASAGGGGGGVGPSASGAGSGRPGQAALQFTLPGTPAGPGTTWDDLIRTIVNAFLSKKGLPPTPSDLNTWTSNFIQNTSLTLSQLDTNIKNSISASSVTTSQLTDSCGGPFPPVSN
jgi:hypothetical protein